MTRQRIPVERDLDMEKMTSVKVESASAYCTVDGTIKVLGELVSMTGEPISSYRNIQVIVYDEDGEILAREYTNWGEFGIRRSFALEIDNEDPSMKPAKAKVFPAKL